jgi:transposase
MKRKRTYSSVDVEKFEVSTVVSLLAVGCIVAVDVAKSKFVAAIATAVGEAVRLVRFEHPRQTRLFLRLLVALREAKLEPRVVMEPTGTYGDAVRYQCHQLQIPVHMMSPKHTHDFAEVLDGVPSMHDPKAAVTLARLQAIRPAEPWEPETEAKRDLRALLDRRAPVSRTQTLYFGPLEGMLARHWPELDALIDVHSQRSWMTLLQRMPTPQAVAAAGEEAAQVLRKASHGALPQDSIAAIVEAARTTLGVPMTHQEQVTLRAVVESIERETRHLDALDLQLADLCRNDPEMARMATVVGPACSAAIVGYIGLPSSYSNARALEKAMGLNLRERSSGEKKGRLTITKRGPGQVRKLLYLAALRMLKADPIVTTWYHGRGAYRREVKRAAVVAVMRKLARALWHIARGAVFDAQKLFDVRRLDLSAPQQKDVRRADAPVSPPAHTLRPGGAPQPTA